MQQKDRDLARLDCLARLLDSRFRIPFTQLRIGVDGLVGLVPLYGDALSFLLSLGVVFYIAKMGVSRALLIRLCLNSILDFIVGLVPFLGDIADIFMKSNLRNVALARKYVENPSHVKRISILYISSVALILLSICVGSLTVAFWVCYKLFGFLQNLTG